MSFEVCEQCADVFHCKAVRAMMSSKIHVVTLMSVELLYVRGVTSGLQMRLTFRENKPDVDDSPWRRRTTD